MQAAALCHILVRVRARQQEVPLLKPLCAACARQEALEMTSKPVVPQTCVCSAADAALVTSATTDSRFMCAFTSLGAAP